MLNIKKAITLAVVSCSFVLAGCQTSQGLYHWGEYESGLYGYYQDPAELATLSEQLLQAIEEANGRVAPGMYAEYGTLMLQQGKTDEAVLYYTRERDLWPESRHLMDAMINNLTNKTGGQKDG